MPCKLNVKGGPKAYSRPLLGIVFLAGKLYEIHTILKIWKAEDASKWKLVAMETHPACCLDRGLVKA